MQACLKRSWAEAVDASLVSAITGMINIQGNGTVMNFAESYLKKAGIAAGGKVVDELHHFSDNRRARSVLSAIEARQGPTNRALIKSSDEYASEVLGSRKYAPWLYVYSAMRNRFIEGWFPDNYYGMVVSPLKNGELGRVANLKSFTNRIFNTEALPDLAYIIDQTFYSRAFAPIPEGGLSRTLFGENSRVFYKSDNFSQGTGVSVMSKDDFNEASVKTYPDGVFQAQINQHPFFSEISPKSTATIRVTTARNMEGSIDVRAAYLRVGRANDEIVKSASHVRIPLNKETGALDDSGYMYDWARIDKHPDTGFVFSGKVIPFFSDASMLCKSLHESCPHLACIGWDLCIDRDDKAKIMEWNARRNDIKFSEATSGPCFLGLGWENLWKDPVAA